MDFAKREEEILEFWKKNKIFEKSVAQRRKGKKFVFYEGPPTANGRPGIHHVEARAFKDLIPRYKTMRGFYAPRKAGWDTHGLPVELEVEKELKLKNKKDIENYGIANFNKKCKESVWKYKEEWEKITQRIGFWIDLENPYVTYENDYIESLWWIIKTVYDKNLMYKGHKVVPQCPRCGTALSSHEVAQGYENVKEDSVFIKFKIKNPGKIGLTGDVFLIAWTTTPWTLPGNVALAIGEKINYVKIKPKNSDEIYILAESLVLNVFPVFDGAELGFVKGKELVGMEYEPLFSGVIKETDENFKNAFKVYPADFVSMKDGTGIVHVAPMYGLEDYELGEKVGGLPKVHTVNPDGTFNEMVPKWQGRFVKDVDKEIIADLKERKILYEVKSFSHDYPFCWRCHTPLIYYAKDSWYFKMSQLRNDLIKNNSLINWVPSHIKEGRFGEWLKEAKDWAVSRERYWGTPIPVWECEKCGNFEAVGSLSELKEKSVKSGNKYFVMRHGEAEHNRKNEVNSKVENSGKYPLTERGKEQILNAIEYLRDKKIDLIFASDFLRTKDTAKLVAENLQIERRNIFYDEKIREIDVGVFDKQKPEVYHEYFSSPIDKFYKNPPEGENLNDVKKRVGNFLEDVDKKYKGKNILIVSHEYPIWMLFSAVAGINEKQSLVSRESRTDFIKTAEVMELDYTLLPHDENFVLDLHRPYIDEIVLPCKCGGNMNRVQEVMDCWFDSGAMPFAQAHYPFDDIVDNFSNKKFDYPADYICEAIDQTRGWFYTLLAIGTLLGKEAPYKNVICLGHILDKNGQKMSKHIGNVVDPWLIINKYGVDTVRWYMYTANSAGEPVCFNEKGLSESAKMFVTLMNVLAFYKMFIHENAEDLKESDLTNVMDRWINSKFNLLAKEVTEKLDLYDITYSARKIEEFIGDLSVWYVRRSRDRFRNGDVSAMKTLRRVLFNLVRLMSPFAPFTTEYIYREMRGSLESVHLEDWPDISGKVIDQKILDDMKEVRGIVSSALQLREKAKIRVRQPLASLKVQGLKFKIQNREELLDLIKDEINVRQILFDDALKEEIELDTELTDELKKEGAFRDLVRYIQDLRKKDGLTPQEKVSLVIETDKVGEKFITDFNKDLSKAVNLSAVEFGSIQEEETVTLKTNSLIFKFKLLAAD
ncbi:MAG: class I tRNA ligase family protein [bacterium]|nr:class I tRNA ligase family protein [bacterium]